MVGPAALYIPKGFSDAGIGGSLVCIVVANVLFALGISRLAPIVVPVCDATASKHRGRMTALTVATVASVAAAYACFGIVCYLAFGDEVNVIASQSLPSTPWPGDAVRGVYVVVVLLTFPLQLFPVTDMFDASGERPRAAAASRVGLVFFLAALAVAFEHKLDHVRVL
ncbi:amino acid transmembrane transporter [Aureococcus anophagefferens]|nr:amino acid transmembrane transporter [Aureococcus anophagefferens]